MRSLRTPRNAQTATTATSGISLSSGTSVSSRRRKAPGLCPHPLLHPVHSGLRLDRGVLPLAVNQAGAAPSLKRAVLVSPKLAGKDVAAAQGHRTFLERRGGLGN